MAPLDVTDRIGFLLTDVARLFRLAFEREIDSAGLGLTPGEARTLSRVAAANGARQSELAGFIGIEPMTLSRYLDGLESKGMVLRRNDPKDGRAKCVVTTPAAEAVLVDIRSRSDDLLERFQAGLLEDEKKALRKALKTMRDNAATEISQS